MGRKVLVVDDDPLVLEVTVAMLEDLGCEPLKTTDVWEAITRLKQVEQIEILITDVEMPGMSGFELAEAAKHIRGGLHVILLSGRVIDSRGFPLIRKPFLEADLKHTMQNTSGLC